MRKIYIFFLISLGFVRCLPHLIIYQVHHNKDMIRYEVKHWLIIKKRNYGQLTGFIFLMQRFPEFRNLFYYRISRLRYLVKWLCPPMKTLILNARHIDRGLYIQHGFATIVGAEYIGRNCWINQQVTVGFSHRNEWPTIMHNVRIHAGAKVIGGIVVNSNAIIGANAVVVKDVPADATVVGVPARVVKTGGRRIQGRKD